jgi:DNA repair protein RadC
LQALALASVAELKQMPGVGGDKAATLVAAFALARRLERERLEESPVLDNPETVVRFIREANRLRNVESFQVLLLNVRQRFLRVEEISQGTLDTLLVHPREVFRAAIVGNAASILLLHNHPSGDPTPSEADIKVTRDLIRAGQLLKISVVDHIIIGRATPERTKDYVSLRELGYFAG